jgi:hypothetical protein
MRQDTSKGQERRTYQMGLQRGGVDAQPFSDILHVTICDTMIETNSFSLLLRRDTHMSSFEVPNILRAAFEVRLCYASGDRLSTKRGGCSVRFMLITARCSQCELEQNGTAREGGCEAAMAG